MPPNTRATNWYGVIATLYMLDIAKYTGLIFIIDNNIRFKVVLLIAMSIMVIVNIYFSYENRDIKIVTFYSVKRAGAQKTDARLGFLILISALILLVVYSWVGYHIISLPLFFKELAN